MAIDPAAAKKNRMPSTSFLFLTVAVLAQLLRSAHGQGESCSLEDAVRIAYPDDASNPGQPAASDACIACMDENAPGWAPGVRDPREGFAICLGPALPVQALCPDGTTLMTDVTVADVTPLQTQWFSNPPVACSVIQAMQAYMLWGEGYANGYNVYTLETFARQDDYDLLAIMRDQLAASCCSGFDPDIHLVCTADDVEPATEVIAWVSPRSECLCLETACESSPAGTASSKP